jgi:hypothetical protein
MDLTQSFSATYAEAREKFRKAAAATGATVDAVTNPERGPHGEELATDVAWVGERSADRVLVMISATHGAEGFCGSGAQVDWLTRGEGSALPANVAVLLVHAINPYGFAWLRRVTEDNVDLNRNWIDFSSPLPANQAYDALADAICPEDWSEETQARCRAVLLNFARENGFPMLQQAISGGQYAHPNGVFYGGARPTWSRRTQESIFQAYLKGAAHVGILDFHTGLGPLGYAERIMTARSGDPEYDRALSWYGRALTSPADGDSTSSDITGDGLLAAPALLPHAKVTGVALEYGTLPTTEVMDALRADAWLHAHGDPTSDAARPIKAAVRDAFYQDSDLWKGMVIGQALLSTKQAIAGLHLA